MFLIFLVSTITLTFAIGCYDLSKVPPGEDVEPELIRHFLLPAFCSTILISLIWEYNLWADKLL